VEVHQRKKMKILAITPHEIVLLNAVIALLLLEELNLKIMDYGP